MASSPQRMNTALDREQLLNWFRENRERSHRLFAMLTPDSYYERPIALRNPVVFYEGHLPAFNFNTVVKRALGWPGINERLEKLFARGIDPEDEAAANTRQSSLWPSRQETLEFGAKADEQVSEALRSGEIEREGDPIREKALAAWTILEHEAMHHETMLYMWHMLPTEQKIRPQAASARPPELHRPNRTVRIEAGRATLGASADAVFGWDNEFPEHQVEVDAFEVDVFNVTNRDFLEFVEAGGYRDRDLWRREDWQWLEQSSMTHPNFWVRRDGEWFWRGMFDLFPLPPNWPVYVSQAEAAAYARWKKRRLMTEAEFHRAAYGTSTDDHERSFPWGDDPADLSRGNFGFHHWDPVAVGSYDAGASAWGVHDLVGNGWEWTSSIFQPFEGFRPMASYPEYSADFFDEHHYVMKGGSPATAIPLLRRSFRNWFRPNYPYVYAKFRCVN